MNELKFKAWDIGNKTMVPNALILTNDTKQLITMDAKYFSRPAAFFKGCIWLQYTNHEDINGKQLAVGDIFDIHQTVNGRNLFVLMGIAGGCDFGGYDVRYAFDTTYKYEYNTNDLFGNASDWAVAVELEIIGNLYENPELLEEG